MLKKVSKQPVVLISCGGTGGHIQPGLSVGEALTREGVSVIFLVNKKKITNFFTSDSKAEFVVFPEIYFSSYLKFWKTFIPAIITLLKLIRLRLCYRVKMVISAGGGAGVIPVVFFHHLGIKTVLMEQNMIMGKGNRFLMSMAGRVYLSFPCKNVTLKSKTKVTGNPVREKIREKMSREDAARILNLKPDLKTLLIMGGSQGAKKINELAMEVVKDIYARDHNIQIIHLTGVHLWDECRDFYQNLNVPFVCEKFYTEMNIIYGLTDFALSRAGGGTIAEFCLYHIPAFYIPFPHASEDHQKENALYVSRLGGGWMIDEKDVFNLKNELVECFFAVEQLKLVRSKTGKIMPSDSHLQIVTDIKEYMAE